MAIHKLSARPSEFLLLTIVLLLFLVVQLLLTAFIFLFYSEILGACLCQPPGLEYEAFMPLLLFVVEENNELVVCVSAVTQEGENSIGLTEVMTDALIEQGPYASFDFEPPSLAMGMYPRSLCPSKVPLYL